MAKVKPWSQKVQAYNKNYENSVLLKDGRILFTKNNGFEYYVRDEKGNDTEITYQYYKATMKNRLK